MKMKVILLICFCMMLADRTAHAVQSPTAVAPQGETFITLSDGKSNIQVKIKTHEVRIGKPSDERPVVIDSNCTYSKYPCSIVDRLSITVNRVSLFVPRSVFCDLADLNRAEISTERNQLVLTLFGGDASESYIVKISFDADHISKRTLSSATEPDQFLEETTYHALTVGD